MNASNHNSWFSLSSKTGNRDDTIKFEDHFRNHAKDAIAPWLEVIFWKMFSTGIDAANDRSEKTERFFKVQNTNPSELWDTCNDFTKVPTKENLKRIMSLLNIYSGIAIAMTFPAFVNPEQFPMIDKHIACWINKNYFKFNSFIPSEYQLRKQSSLGKLSIIDYDFCKSWIGWCKYMAGKLSEITDIKWRARDVEMAVFTANRTGINLEPLVVL